MLDIHESESVPDPMTVQEFARLHRISEGMVLGLIKSGRLSAYRIGKPYRITRAAHDDYLRRCNPEIWRQMAEEHHAEHLAERKRKRRASV